jgi:hypothetical protein
MDSLKFYPGPPCPTFPLWAGHPQNGLTAFFWVARSLCGWPAAVFYPLRYPTPYGLGKKGHTKESSSLLLWGCHRPHQPIDRLGLWPPMGRFQTLTWNNIASVFDAGPGPGFHPRRRRRRRLRGIRPGDGACSPHPSLGLSSSRSSSSCNQVSMSVAAMIRQTLNG